MHQRKTKREKEVSTLLAVAIAACAFLCSGCNEIEQQHQEPVVKKDTSQALALFGAAKLYVLSYYDQLPEGKPIQCNELLLMPGSNAGQTLAPTREQLIKIGYANEKTPQGNVHIELTPPGCSPKDCRVQLSAEVKDVQIIGVIDTRVPEILKKAIGTLPVAMK